VQGSRSAVLPAPPAGSPPAALPAGGDTRLVAVPFHCDFPALVEALERAAAPPGGASCSAESASDAAPRTFVSGGAAAGRVAPSWQRGCTRALPCPYSPRSSRTQRPATPRVPHPTPAPPPSPVHPHPPQAPSIKYRLPSDPSVWVDLLDDDDVAVRGGGKTAGLHAAPSTCHACI
jgi:hypothetical protein